MPRKYQFFPMQFLHDLFGRTYYCMSEVCYTLRMLVVRGVFVHLTSRQLKLKFVHCIVQTVQIVGKTHKAKISGDLSLCSHYNVRYDWLLGEHSNGGFTPVCTFATKVSASLSVHLGLCQSLTPQYIPTRLISNLRFNLCLEPSTSSTVVLVLPCIEDDDGA